MSTKRIVYTAQSKQYFYCRDAVCQFVFERQAIPLNPFRMFDYFLGDRVERDDIRAANNAVISRCDEVWVFGDTLADGVLLEIALAAQKGKPIRYFTINNSADRIEELSPESLRFEAEVMDAGLTEQQLLDQALSGRVSDLLDALGRPARVAV